MAKVTELSGGREFGNNTHDAYAKSKEAVRAAFHEERLKAVPIYKGKDRRRSSPKFS